MSGKKMTRRKSGEGWAGFKESDDNVRPLWPREKPIPEFTSYEDEVRFWHSYRFEAPDDAKWVKVTYKPKATRRPRQHVFPVRLDDEEAGVVQALAKRDGVPASVAIRQLIRAARARLLASQYRHDAQRSS